MKKIFFVLLTFLLSVQVFADTTKLADTYTDTTGVLLINHTADTNNTGNVYRSLHALKTTSEWTIQSNAMQLAVGVFGDNSWTYPRGYISLGTSSSAGTITYKWLALHALNAQNSRLVIRSNRVGGLETMGTSCSGYAISIKGNNQYANLWLGSNTANAMVTISDINLGEHTAGTYMPIKVTDNGNSISVYADLTGTEATTLRIVYLTTLNNTNQEISFYCGSQGNASIDSLNITQVDLNTATPTATPTTTQLATATPTTTATATPTATPRIDAIFYLQNSRREFKADNSRTAFDIQNQTIKFTK